MNQLNPSNYYMKKISHQRFLSNYFSFKLGELNGKKYD